MKGKKNFDSVQASVAVIGGGPIGLFTAIKLAQKGYFVDLYEKSSWPRDKVCGQGIMPLGHQILSDLGINWDGIDDSCYFDGIDFIDREQRISGLFSFQSSQTGKAIGVERKILSQKLFQLASSSSQVKLHSLSFIKKASIHDGKCELVIFKGDEDRVIHKNYLNVFVCDGLNSIIRKQLKNESIRKKPWRMGARVHYKIPPWSNKVEVYFANGVEAYVTPVAKDKVEIAFLWFTDRFNHQKDLYTHLINTFPTLKNKVLNLACEGDFKGYGPFQKISKKIKKGPFYFLGDSYLFLDGITGEGISLGLKVASLIVENFPRPKFLTFLQIHWIYAKYKMTVYFMYLMSRNPSLRKIIFNNFRFNRYLFKKYFVKISSTC